MICYCYQQTKKYDPEKMVNGFNHLVHEDGTEEDVYFVQAPALGLWAYKGRFENR